jgi:hypothetical protein
MLKFVWYLTRRHWLATLPPLAKRRTNEASGPRTPLGFLGSSSCHEACFHCPRFREKSVVRVSGGIRLFRQAGPALLPRARLSGNEPRWLAGLGSFARDVGANRASPRASRKSRYRLLLQAAAGKPQGQRPITGATGMRSTWDHARLMIVLSGNIRSPPPTIAPRQIPPAIGREHARHQIKPTRASGVAPAQPRERHPAPGPKSEPANRLVGVMRACWQVSAVHSDQQRKRAAV